MTILMNCFGTSASSLSVGRLAFNEGDLCNLYVTEEGGIYRPEFFGEIIVWIKNLFFPYENIQNICSLFQRALNDYNQHLQNAAFITDQVSQARQSLKDDLDFVVKLIQVNNTAFEHIAPQNSPLRQTYDGYLTSQQQVI